MAQTKYTYSIADDTLNAAVNPTNLTAEIGIADIVIALDYINTSDDVLDIYFKDAISAEDKTTLDAVVSAHENGATAGGETWEYQDLDSPTQEELNDEGALGWEEYQIIGTIHKLKRTL